MGFSDHAPYIFPNGHKSNFRMDCDEAQGYANSVRELQEKYKGVIDIKLGFEVEYYPELIEKELEFLKSFKYDYIILGQHFTDNEYEPYADTRVTKPTRLQFSTSIYPRFFSPQKAVNLPTLPTPMLSTSQATERYISKKCAVWSPN